jgi:hypothetical protein
VEKAKKATETAIRVIDDDQRPASYFSTFNGFGNLLFGSFKIPKEKIHLSPIKARYYFTFSRAAARREEMT